MSGEENPLHKFDKDDGAADPAVVRANLAAHGFHLQFPPTLLDPMVDG